MRKALIAFVAIIIKIMIIGFYLDFSFSLYDVKKDVIEQSGLVYILIYIPMILGIESIINIALSKSKKEESKK